MYEDYLSEPLLGIFLKERIDPDLICNKKLGEYGRPDYRSEKYKFIVEFDGPQHYTSAKNCMNDIRKDIVGKKLGYNVIRVPYFFQLDDDVISWLFYKYTSDDTSFNNYPHGFVSDNVVLPADFCELGIKRFRKDLGSIDRIKVKRDIVNSLYLKISLHDDIKEMVLPPSLFRLLEHDVT